ncbi:hypothetical protein FB45DRAFT_892741 [Roridomyces roridus]|uniref:Uncharacterized protein n=1 Tax=Roridomyces roridus TaxID=1738132 RepID=A0AAD7CEZ9_9AGAR|nr:hypothetical protein FB45DRAFT_892741 [Roridomyces roridus]
MAALYPISNARAERLPDTPPSSRPILPATPSPVYTTVEHPDVHLFLNHLDFVQSSPGLLHHYSPPSKPTIFALAALAVFSSPHDKKWSCFWGLNSRVHTARSVQAVLESGQNLIIPFFWPGVAGALSQLAEREARVVAAVKKRKAAEAAVAKEVEPPQKVQRVTRASVRQQQSEDTGRPVRASVRKAQQQKQQQQQQDKEDDDVLPIVRPPHTRAPSTTSSQYSSETTVVSSSPWSRGASVATVVESDIADSVIGGDKKGKGRETDAAVAVAPIVSEDADPAAASIMTRSRTSTRKTLVIKCATTKTRRTPTARRAPTGKRKTAKVR